MKKVVRIQVPIPHPVKWVNCYYFPGTIPTLIDTGVNTDEGLIAIEKAIEAEGGRIRDIRRIIATHGHTDHIGLAGRIAETSGAEIFLHPWDTVRWTFGSEDPYRARESDFRAFFVEAGVPADDIDPLVDFMLSRYQSLCSPILTETAMEDGTVFEFDDFALQALHTPGHSPGSVSLFDASDGILYAGDTLLPEIISNPTIEKSGTNGHKSLLSHLATLRRIKELGARTVMPGHGTPFEDIHGTIERIEAHHSTRTQDVLRILEQSETASNESGGMTQFAVAAKLFGDLSGLDIFYGVSSARAHLDALEGQGVAERHKEDGQHVYRPTGTRHDEKGIS
jgi:glyoxylase-like metal-dependent hydrolase (beta-lactamase superfamily II)